MSSEKDENENRTTSTKDDNKTNTSENKEKDKKSDDLQNYLKILQLFPDLHPMALYKMFERCNKEFCRTIDNILFVKRYCYFLNAVRKFKTSTPDESLQKSETAQSVALVTTRENSTQTDTIQTNSTTVHPVQCSTDQNYSEPINNYSNTSEMQVENSQNLFSPVNAPIYNSENNATYTVDYFDTSPCIYSSHGFTSSTINNSTAIDYASTNQTDYFFNSQDIVTPHTSYASSGQNDTYLRNGAMDDINYQLNNYANNNSFVNNSLQYDQFNNLLPYNNASFDNSNYSNAEGLYNSSTPNFFE